MFTTTLLLAISGTLFDAPSTKRIGPVTAENLPKIVKVYQDLQTRWSEENVQEAISADYVYLSKHAKVLAVKGWDEAQLRSMGLDAKMTALLGKIKKNPGTAADMKEFETIVKSRRDNGWVKKQ